MRFEKYVRVLDMLNRIGQEDQRLRAELASVPYQEQMACREAAALRYTDELLEYLHANWPRPSWYGGRVSSQQDKDEKDRAGTSCSEMLRMDRQEFEEKMETLPPFFCEYVFPCCAVRYVLRELNAPFRHRQSKHFGEFHHRYGHLILDY